MLSSLLATILITHFSLSTISYCSPAASERQLRGHSFGPQRDISTHHGRDHTAEQEERANAVIDQFRFAWNGYYTYAYPHDDYFPQNSSFSDSRNGWGLTMIDGLDTAILMEQTDIVDIILDFVPTVDFTKNNARPAHGPSSTSLFETNIRYLGGMLGAYDLLKGPFSHLASDEDKVDALLSQAATLADSLKFAFDTPTGIPINDVYINNKSFTDVELQDDGTYVAGLAELGTLVLEW